MRDVFYRRVGCAMRFEMALGTQKNIEFFDNVHRKPDSARLIHDGAFDVLAYPPRSISGKTKTALGFEFFQRVDQAQIALFDQIQKRHTAVHIVFGDIHHQPQIAFNHALARLEIALLHQAR